MKEVPEGPAMKEVPEVKEMPEDMGIIQQNRQIIQVSDHTLDISLFMFNTTLE